MGVVVRQKKKGEGNPFWVFITKNYKRTSMLIGSKEEAEKVANHLRTQIAIETLAIRDVVAKQIEDKEILKMALLKRQVNAFDKVSLPDSYIIPILKKQGKPITPATIEFKRHQILMKRTLREFKKWRQENEPNHTNVHRKQHENEENYERRL